MVSLHVYLIGRGLIFVALQQLPEHQILNLLSDFSIMGYSSIFPPQSRGRGERGGDVGHLTRWSSITVLKARRYLRVHFIGSMAGIPWHVIDTIDLNQI